MCAPVRKAIPRESSKGLFSIRWVSTIKNGLTLLPHETEAGEDSRREIDDVDDYEMVQIEPKIELCLRPKSRPQIAERPYSLCEPP